LSTFIWKDTVNKVIGVEPNKEMSGKAEAVLQSLGKTKASFSFVNATSSETGLPDNSVDIVTARFEVIFSLLIVIVNLFIGNARKLKTE
jgi:ubiquinone/menaquinone biosynthesis C-methylase UbiE